MTAYESNTKRLTQQELGACALIEDLLPLYLEGEVSPGSRDLIVEHLARCERCAGFLAGAQSVRSQLRRDQQRFHSVAAATHGAVPAAPITGGIIHKHPIMALMVMLGACGLSSIGASMFAVIDHGPDPQMLGSLLMLFGFGGLVLLGRSSGRWTAVRFLALMTAFGLGCVAAIFIAHAPAGLAVVGGVMGLLALFGIWQVLVNGTRGAAQAAPAADGADAAAQGAPAASGLSFKITQPMVMAGGLVLAGLASMVLLAQDISISLQSPVVALLVVVGGLLLWNRERKQPGE
ncbi:MAG TPA: zf-HC2 domain-containing protein [Herpetosiphonaceae bacterium]|nr:zf-HC2 domain-containing protein [Herpetosiphonaceae bacterium]